MERDKKEINDNLLGMGAVKMVLHKDLDRKLQKEALSYLNKQGWQKVEVIVMEGHVGASTRRKSQVVQQYQHMH